MIVNTLIFVLSFVVVLSLIVFIHELGHYGVGKFFNTRVDRFSVGFGKPIFKRTLSSGEEWVVGRWPLGGYVMFTGDRNARSQNEKDAVEALSRSPDAPYLFQFKPLYQRALIVAAGPIANFLLAIVLFAGLAGFWGDNITRTRVAEVMSGSAAEAAGIQVEDSIIRIDDREISRMGDVQSYVAIRAGEPMELLVERAGREVTIPITPRRVVREDGIGGQAALGTLGVLMTEELVEHVDYGPLQSLARGTERLGETISMTGTYVGRIFLGKEDGKALGGVLRIFAMTGKVAVDSSAAEVRVSEERTVTRTAGQRTQSLLFSMMTLMAVLSVGLGLANLVPIPALDGGHLLYYAYEAVAGRPLSLEAQAMGYRLGVVLLIGIFVYLTFNDIGYIRSLTS